MPLSDTTVLALRDSFNVISASEEIVEVLNRAVVANDFPGTDIGAKVNNAMAWMDTYRPNGGDIQILPDTYEFSTPINMGARNNIRIIGQGGVPAFEANTGIGVAGTQLNYEGVDTAIYIGNGVDDANGAELHNFQLHLDDDVVGVKIESHIRGIMNNFSVVGPSNGLGVGNFAGTGIKTVSNNVYGWIYYNLIANYLKVGVDLLNGWGTHFYIPRFAANEIGIVITGGAGTFFHGGDIELNHLAGVDVISGRQADVNGVYFETSRNTVDSRAVRVGSGAFTPESVAVKNCTITRDGTVAEHAIELAKCRGFRSRDNYYGEFDTSAIKNTAGTEIEYGGDTVHASLPLFIDSETGVVDGHDPITGARVINGGLPASDPSVAGVWWANSGIVTISAG